MSWPGVFPVKTNNQVYIYISTLFDKENSKYWATWLKQYTTEVYKGMLSSMPFP